jgi:SAM-dependent methyltransferase
MPLDNLKAGACTICGGKEFSFQPVLWPSLVQEWELGEHEVDYINRQQGHSCRGCGSSMRVRVLALAILSMFAEGGTFADFIHSSSSQQLKILEINKAGNLHEFLKEHPGHMLVEYPEYDMMSLKLPDHHFDLVIHSDTLEHVSDPVRALGECRRVLKETGRCIFTVPIIVGRLSRSRAGMTASYHGAERDKRPDFLVHTEFGSDLWTYALKAGFSKVSIYPINYPSAHAIVASC